MPDSLGRSNAGNWPIANQRQVKSKLTIDHQSAMAQAAQREADLRIELETAQNKIRDLQKRVFGRKSKQRLRRDTVL